MGEQQLSTTMRTLLDLADDDAKAELKMAYMDGWHAAVLAMCQRPMPVPPAFPSQAPSEEVG